MLRESLERLDKTLRTRNVHSGALRMRIHTTNLPLHIGDRPHVNSTVQLIRTTAAWEDFGEYPTLFLMIILGLCFTHL